MNWHYRQRSSSSRKRRTVKKLGQYEEVWREASRSTVADEWERSSTLQNLHAKPDNGPAERVQLFVVYPPRIR